MKIIRKSDKIKSNRISWFRKTLMIFLTINSSTRIISELFRLIKMKIRLPLHLRIVKTHSVTQPNPLIFSVFQQQRELMIKDSKLVLSNKMKKFFTIHNKNKMGAQCYLDLARLQQQPIKLLCNKKLLRKNKLKNKSRE